MLHGDPVGDAVSLLRQRLDELRNEQADIVETIAQIERALDHLGYGSSAAAADLGAPAVEHGSGPLVYQGMTITAAVRALLEAERGPWTPSMVRDRLEGSGVQGDRSSKKFLEAISTAFYTMRTRGEARSDDRYFTVATKWLSGAGFPAGEGVLGTEEPSYGPPPRKERGTGA